MSKKLSYEEYTVGWICPLEVEQIAAMEMLDEEHERLSQAASDHNVYNLGSIAGHNVVIAGLYHPGNNPAATVVTQMRMTFPNLRFGLLVGIGGGVPVMTDNGMVRLGDVVVSKPVGEHSGAVQYDHGKAKVGQFERTGALAPPPAVLLNAAQDLAAKRARSRKDPVEENIKRIDLSIRGLRRYRHPGPEQDYLFKPHYTHQRPGIPCDECGCDPLQRVQRLTDDDDDEPYIVVHRGTIASGELVVKDAKLRDQLAKEYGLLCFEMEAAGALADFPCIVIRGVSDYCDSHKNDQWHGYAAAAAAAYARQLFFHMPIEEVKRCISSSAETDIHHVKLRQDNQDRQGILHWLAPVDYGPQHSDILRRRQPGTGEWLLESAEYQSWLNTGRPTLFCPGIPGAGKTMIATIVIDHLLNKIQNSSVGVAYVYFNYKAREEQDATSLLAAMLKQLVQARPSLLGGVEQLYLQHADKGTKPSLDEISKILEPVLVNHSTVYIVIDALDECRDSDGTRWHLLVRLRELQTRTNLRLMVTSRNMPEIVEEFQEERRLEVKASNEDVKLFVAGQIYRLPKCIQRDSLLQDIVQEKIVEAVDGMFLLARLYVDSLLDKRTPKDVKAALAHLSRGSAALHNAYTEAIQRIKCQLSGDYKLAKKVLSWITYAKRPLTTAEICCAFSIESGDTELDREKIPHAEDLVSVCAGLVVVDEESTIIRLVHYTTHEFFESIGAQWDPYAQLDIASTCLTYLCFNAFTSGSCATDEMFEEQLQNSKFLDYAAKHWGDHAKYVEVNVCKQVCSFLLDDGLISCAVQVLSAPAHKYERYSQDYPKRVTGLHLIAQFGLSMILEKVLSRQVTNLAIAITIKDSYDRTPLYLAAEHGHIEMVRLMLNKGAGVNPQSECISNALVVASGNGHEQIVKLLLEKGADVNLQSEKFGSALVAASYHGHEQIVKLLLEKGADVNLQSGIFGSALVAASGSGHEQTVKMLLEKGADVNLQSREHRSALVAASGSGHEQTVKMLLEKGADINLQSREHGSALVAASYHGHEQIVKLLLEKGADVNLQSGIFGSALVAASYHGHEQTVKLLLEKGADVNLQSGIFGSALVTASGSGHEQIVKLLLEKGADVNLQSREHRSALVAASGSGHEQTVKMLLEKGADVNLQSGIFGSALVAASYHGHEQIVKLLLEKGADINLQSREHRSALVAASGSGHEQTVKMLLEKGADINLQSREHRSALMAASGSGHEQTVKMLLEKGADINLQSREHRSALVAASGSGHEQTVKLLLEKGADINLQSREHGSALVAASGSGHEQTVKMLLEKGADVNLHGGYFGSALGEACGNGHVEVVKSLLDAGSNPNSLSCHLGSSLHILAFYGYTDILRLVCDQHHGNPLLTDLHGRTLLHLAARGNNLNTLLYLLSLGLDPETTDIKGENLLHHASSGGSLEILNEVLKMNCCFDTQSGRWSPLHWACRIGNPHIVERLIGEELCSGSVTVPQEDARWSPISIAIFHGQEKMLEKLAEPSRSLLETSDGDVSLCGKLWEHVICDGCLHNIYGSRFHCRTCPDLDYCFMCKPFLSHLHENHEWDCVESPI